MGSDIHTYLERKQVINGKERWVSIDYWKNNPYYYNSPNEERKMDVVHVYNNRNYSIFSILADVRNYGNNEPIAKPKGLPVNVSPEVKTEFDYWGCDAHSTSYLTLKELIDWFEKNPKQKYRGMISQSQQKDLDKGILPSEWCQGTDMEGYEFREWEDESELIQIIKPIKERVMEEFWIYDFQKDKEERIKKIADNIRIVFWFDN